MQTCLRLTVAMIAIPFASWSAHAVAQDVRKSRETALANLVEEYERAKDQYMTARRNAGTNGKRPSSAYWTKEFPACFLRFARQAHDDASLEACRYLIANFYISSERLAAIKLVAKHHLDKAKIGEFFLTLVHGYDDDEAADECLHTAMKSQNRNTRAHATYQYARLLISRRDRCLDGDANRYEG